MREPITVSLTGGDIKLAERHAAAAAVGGVSRVHKAAADRQAKLTEDQIIGQLGQLAIHKFLYGTVHGYAVSRYYQNKFPTLGDQGEDITGANVDVKTSVMRYGQDPLAYKLWVREREWHAGWVYVLALLPKEWRTVKLVYLVGWAGADEFPDLDRDSPTAADRFELAADALHPLPPIRYTLFGAA